MHPLQQAFPLPPLSPEALSEIVQADWERNLSQSAYTPAYLLNALQSWIASGSTVCYNQKVILLGISRPDGIFEFHTVNGGTVRNLLRVMREFLTVLADTVAFAGTWYDNPRIGEIAPHLHFPYVTRRVDEGVDKTFSTIFTLRSS